MKNKPKKILDHFVLIYTPRHERAYSTGYVPEHILIAEKSLGRSLTPDEGVRHINGNPHDNRPTNLEVFSFTGSSKTSIVEDSGEPRIKSRSPAKTFLACKFQRPCWKNVRAPIARKHGVYLPYICSFQIEGDIYKCSHFWRFLDEEMENNKRKDDNIG